MSAIDLNLARAERDLRNANRAFDDATSSMPTNKRELFDALFAMADVVTAENRLAAARRSAEGGAA